jgi:hypothetical protein
LPEFIRESKAMSNAAYIALFALVAMVVLYAIEDRWSLALLGFSVAAAIVAVSDFVLGRWPLGIAVLGFVAVASRRWYVRQRQDGHGGVTKSV